MLAIPGVSINFAPLPLLPAFFFSGETKRRDSRDTGTDFELSFFFLFFLIFNETER